MRADVKGQSNLLGFDSNFFAAYEQELSDISVEEVAQAALADILTIQREAAPIRTFAEITSEAEAFFANPVIAENVRLLDMMASQFAQFCEAHGHGAMEQTNDNPLSAILERAAHADEGHDHTGHEPDEEDTTKKKTSSERSVGALILNRNFWLAS